MNYLKFWGVRGSIPTPGPSTARYGGNTACAELRIDGQLIILDAGTGLRNLGNALMANDETVDAIICISHMHWDHIQGIPFFTPAYIPGNKITFFGANHEEQKLKSILSGQMQPTHFPVSMGDMQAELEFNNIFADSYRHNGIEFETIFLHHPGHALGFKFYINNKSIVYISDNEPYTQAEIEQDETVATRYAQLAEFVNDADILIHDAQYTPEEYENHKTWGHSPFTFPVDLARTNSVKKLILFHHDPLHNDDVVDDILVRARAIAAKEGNDLEIIAAAEGLTLELS